MTIHFQCENCKHPFIAPKELFGRRAICPQCKSTIHVPEPGESSTEEFHIVRDGWKVEDRQADTMPSNEQLPPVDRVAGHNIASREAKSKAGLRDTGVGSSGRLTVTDRPDSSQSPATSVLDKISISTAEKVIAPAPGGTMAQASRSPDALWFVRPSSGGQFGPASMSLLRQWKAEGRVTGDSWVWQQGWDDWQRATVIFSDLVVPVTEAIVDPKARVETTRIVSKTAYMRARRRRSVLVTIGLSLGTIIIAALLLALFYVLRDQGGG
jgi:GYF domain 2